MGYASIINTHQLLNRAARQLTVEADFGFSVQRNGVVNLNCNPYTALILQIRTPIANTHEPIAQGPLALELSLELSVQRRGAPELPHRLTHTHTHTHTLPFKLKQR